MDATLLGSGSSSGDASNHDAVHGQDERVILIHGTFAASDSDSGDAWWQVGSQTYRELQKKLPSSVSLAKQGEAFHWSGENNERSRNKAAVKLLEYLGKLEAAGTSYHLIGHSHGGSVIWSAMRIATLRNKPLHRLRSWSTVGTPFLHQRSRSPWNVLNMAQLLMAALLIYPAIRTFVSLVRLPYDLVSGKMDNGIIMRNGEEVGFVTAIVRAPLVEGLKLLGVSFTEVPGGTRVGSYTAESGQSAAEFLFMSREGLLILTGIAMLGYLLLLLGSWFVRPVLESWRFHLEHRLEQRAFDLYSGRWLGLWTQDDEAINGLRATLELSVTFLSRLVPRERIFFSDTISLVARPWFWIFAPVYNVAILPFLDSTIRGVVIRSAQGNNRPAARVVAVAPTPILPPEAPDLPPLPAKIRARILAQADQHANRLGPAIRQLLSRPSFTAGLESFGKDLTGRELVHTSYFNDPDVLNLLAENIHWSQTEPSPLRICAEAPLMHWFADYKRLLGAEMGASNLHIAPRKESARDRNDQREAA